MPRDFAPRGGGAGADGAGADGAGTGGPYGRGSPEAHGGRDLRSHGRRRGFGPVPGPYVVPDLAPVRPGLRGRHRLHRIVRGRRRVTAAGLAVAAAALVAQVPRGERGGSVQAEAGQESPAGPTAATPRAHGRPPGRQESGSAVSAPVRIADAAAVRLLRKGDRVDVIAGPGVVGGPDGTERARVVARSALVYRVPRPAKSSPVGTADDGALVVLKVPRGTATALAGAGAAGRLAVTLC